VSDGIRYPIGRFQYREPTPALRRSLIAQFADAPGLLRAAVEGLDGEQLLTRYREDGWTVAQVVHHVAESDVNAYPRLKYALTEDNPAVLVAQQDLWAALPDAQSAALESSLALFEAIRGRWVEAWMAVGDAGFSRAWTHPRYGRLTVDHVLQQYAWHALHHTEQIIGLRRRMGW